MAELKCPDCGGSMKQGFILDEGYGMVYDSKWIEGLPERSIWYGVKVRGKTKYRIASYRCEQCGLLKSYAPKPAS